MPSAYLLVFHGSRDPRPQAAVNQLAQLLKLRVDAKNWLQTAARKHPLITTSAVLTSTVKPLVGTASLELAPLPLHKQIQQFGDRAQSFGCNRLQLLPLFLLPGVHVMEDIPAEVAQAQLTLSPKLTIEVCPSIGTHPEIGRLLMTQNATAQADARILLSHGSRRRNGNQSVEAIASELKASPAYWSMSPTLEEQVEELVKAGKQQIAILSYFLFPGGITDAIANAVERLQQRFPSVQLRLSDPIGVSSELTDLVLDLFPA